MKMNEVLDKVSEITGVPSDVILSRKRTREVCDARNIFIYISKTYLYVSEKNIASFTNRTRQNISHQLTQFEHHIKIYRPLKEIFESIKSEVA